MSGTELLNGLIGCIDLTNLDDDCDSSAIAELCTRAQSRHGNVAAVCVWPKFVAEAKERLSGTGVKVATVVNFPDGGEDTLAIEAATRQALADGADEIDLVMPYKALAAGRPGFAETQIVRIKRICGDHTLKVILETGELQDTDTIRNAANVALAAGADFLKTSTGKVATNATKEAVEVLLAAISNADRKVGAQPAGGIRTASEVVAYFDMVKRINGDEAPNPSLFRIGANSALDDMITAVDGH